MSSKDSFDNNDFEKIFSEIVSSNDLNNISEDIDLTINMGAKELLLIQQSLADNISSISEIICSIVENEGSPLLSDKECFELLGSIYKISEDLNDYILDHYSTIQAAIIDDELDEDIYDIEEEDYNDDDDDFE